MVPMPKISARDEVAASSEDEDEDDCLDPGDQDPGGDLRFAPSSSEDEPALQAWIARIVMQDEDALADLYRTLIGRVYGLVVRIVQDGATAEEVAEDTFWQVWRQAPRFDPDRGRALTWVLMIARSRALDALRQRRRLAESTEQHFSVDPESLAAANEQSREGLPEYGMGADPCDLLEALQDAHHLHRSLEKLEPQARQMVALAFFRGLTHQEIAEHTGIPLGTVKSCIRRALLALRGWMDSANMQAEEMVSLPSALIDHSVFQLVSGKS